MSHGISSPLATVWTWTSRSQRSVSGHVLTTEMNGLPPRQRRANSTEAALLA